MEDAESPGGSRKLAPLLDLSDYSVKNVPKKSVDDKRDVFHHAGAEVDFTDLTQTRGTRTAASAPDNALGSRKASSPERVVLAGSGRTSPVRMREGVSADAFGLKNAAEAPKVIRPNLRVVTPGSAAIDVAAAPRTSLPRTQLSPPRRASSYQVRTPAENRYMSYKHYGTFQQLASSQKSILVDQALWSSVLRGDRLPQPQTSQEAFDLEMLTLQIGEGISKTNAFTANFNVLLLSLLSHMRYMRVAAYDGEWSCEAYNTIFLVRLCIKYYIFNLSQIEIHEHFEMDRTLPLNIPKDYITSSFQPGLKLERITVDSHILQDKRLRAQQLLEELFHVVIYAESSSPTNYDFYMEVLNLLIVMASMQLKPPSSEPGDGLYFMEIILDRLSHFAGGAMARLLLNYVNRVAHAGPSSGMLYSAYSYLYLFSAKRQEDRQPSPLADKSAMLLLILANQNPKHFANEFMEAIRRLQDSNVTQSAADDGTTVKISFRQLYQTLRSTVSSEESCMILYPLLVHNRNFRTYIMSRSDPESLLLPVLKAIYEFSEQKGNYQQLYMLLIIVLLLSQDNDFIESIQKITVQSHTWYTERVVKSVSLGGLSILVLIRTVQTNLATYKDVYCHTLCAAILANLSNSVVGLNSVVAQRIVSFYEMVAKRYLKLLDQLGQDSAEKLPSNPSKTESVDHDFDTLIYGDLVALLLEMMNSIITYALKHNPELVYALLQKRDAFAPFREVPRLQDFVENIDKVIAHFHKKLQEADLKILSTVEVGEVIDRATKTWNASTLKVFSILKFRYEESPQEWQFSIPYVWQTVFNRSLIYWDDESALLIQGFMDERTDNLHQIL